MDGHDGIHGRNMICHLINALGSRSWAPVTSADVSAKYDDSIFFTYDLTAAVAPPSVPPPYPQPYPQPLMQPFPQPPAYGFTQQGAAPSFNPPAYGLVQQSAPPPFNPPAYGSLS